MSFSVENLLSDAIKLSMNLKECEIESDNLIFQTVKLSKDNENIKEYSEDMSALSNRSIKQPRKSLIASIQCESKKMKQLEAENLELKSTLQDYELVMKLMSQKYRNHISKMISHMKAESSSQSNSVINTKYKQKIEEQSQKINEQSVKIDNLAAFIQKIMNLDIQNFLDIQKSLTRVELENQGLRQMLKIANDHKLALVGSTSDANVQTEPVENREEIDLSFNDSISQMGNLNISIDMNISSELNNIRKFNHDSHYEDKNCATIKKAIKNDHLKLNSSNEQTKP